MKVTMKTKGGYKFTDHLGITSVDCIIAASEIPDLSKYFGINARLPHAKDKSSRTILKALENDDDGKFHHKANGARIFAKNVLLTNGKVTFDLTNKKMHGVVNGAHLCHTLNAHKDSYGDTCIRLTITDSWPDNNIAGIVEALNNVNPQKKVDVARLEGTYDDLENILRSASFGPHYSAKTGDRHKDGVDKSIKMAHVLQLMSTLDRDSFVVTDSSAIHPQEISYGGGKVVKHFTPERLARFRNRLFIINSLKLRDYIYLAMSEQILEADLLAMPSIVAYRRSVPSILFGKNPEPSEYKIPEAYICLVMASMRVFVKTNSKGHYVWASNPFKLFDDISKGVMSSLKVLQQYNNKGNNFRIGSIVRDNPAVWDSFLNITKGHKDAIIQKTS